MVNIIISSLELHGKPSKKNAEPFGVRNIIINDII